MGYAVFNYDKGAFINPTTQSIIMCHVDDLLITGPNADKIMAQINMAKDDIKIQALGEVDTFLGINILVDYKNKTLYIH